MSRKYFIYFAIMAVLLIAWYYRTSIEESISKNIKNVRNASPYTDDRVESEINSAMYR